jgi:hypothetical protein
VRRSLGELSDGSLSRLCKVSALTLLLDVIAGARQSLLADLSWSDYQVILEVYKVGLCWKLVRLNSVKCGDCEEGLNVHIVMVDFVVFWGDALGFILGGSCPAFGSRLQT